MTGEELERLVARFLDGSLPKPEWTHHAHLRVGAWHVATFGADEALARLRAGIRALNERHGTPNTETSGYHETITIAFIRGLDRELARVDGALPLETRVQRIVDGPLADVGWPFRHWSRALLLSPAARAAWVPPDLAAL